MRQIQQFSNWFCWFQLDFHLSPNLRLAFITKHLNSPTPSHHNFPMQMAVSCLESAAPSAPSAVPSAAPSAAPSAVPSPLTPVPTTVLSGPRRRWRPRPKCSAAPWPSALVDALPVRPAPREAGEVAPLELEGQGRRQLRRRPWLWLQLP